MPPSVPPSVPPVDFRPRLSPEEAAALARELFGVEGEARPLPSDRDQNFHIGGAGEEAYVLKVANAAAEPALLEAQHALLAHLAERGVPAPRLRPSLQGETLLTIDGTQGRRHAVWMLTYLPGATMESASPVTPALLHNLGAFLGRLHEALAGFDHPGAYRDFEWDLRLAPATVRTYLDHVEDAGRRELVARFLDRFDADVAPRLGALRRSIVHGDANDHNVIVGPPAHPERSIVGLIDFGDVVHTYTVCEAAIAAAYAMMDQSNPLAAASALVAGYHDAFPLHEEELAVLFDLAVLRLCLSVCMSAYQQRREPDNRYLSVSERPAWALLERLAPLPSAYAHYRFRSACGLPPCPHGEAVRGWLARHGSEAAPLVRPDPRKAPVHVFDFSVSSTEWDHEALTRPGLAGDAILARLRAAGNAVGIGRYDEVRLVYSADQFGGADGMRRTLHIGLDLFQPAGAPIFAPFDGVVHSFRDNDLPLDYGPTLILTHTPEDGPPFHTLYGHLDRAALEGLRVGQAVRRGQRIGALGTAEENGGWAPHLHFQVIADLLGAEGDFPGVAPAGERDLWHSLCPDPNLLLGVPTEAFPPPSPTASALYQARARLVGPSLSLSYRTPLHLVRGYRQHLFDADGRAYLDAVNNVPHVGHSHPHVVRAAERQMTVLNTNTRYLHENLIRYAERLTGYLPEPLRVCFFVNSGSEANDLALRLARAYTGRRDVVVLDGAYHGHLTSLIDVSPYKFDGPGGPGRAPHTHVVPLPDPYRGRYRDAGAGAQYAEHVREAAALAEQAGGLAAFLAEPILSCGGQVVPPPGFLHAAYGHVRAAGGLCIADEVQVGFGRVGTHFWAFETQDVVPDIVTLGKPIGNGHPLGAVVTTPAVAEAFANGMEYFNTFGGNPVSCAVGLAVLDVLEAEGLQSHALHTGAHLMERLRALQPRHPVVGEVRGRGLFIGMEFVADPEARTPAPAQAAYAVERMKTHGILLSTDGPDRNVLKIKPPLPFSRQDADRLADTLDAVLGEDFVRRAVSA